MADSEIDFKPRDFVFLGRRIMADGSVSVAIAVINEDGTLGPQAHYDDGKDWKGRAVGAVYTGALFSEKSVKGCTKAVYTRRWPSTLDLVEWQSRHHAADAHERTQKLEKDARKTDEVEALLLPLRKRYEALRKKYDRPGMMALEAAVVRALMAAPRASEKD